MSSASTATLTAQAAPAASRTCPDGPLLPSPRRVVPPERKQVLAASAPWLGALLNLLPGLGSGYLYQRRWRAWWITGLLVLLWNLAAVPFGAAQPESVMAGPSLRYLSGLLLLSAGTACEAFLAARKARHD